MKTLTSVEAQNRFGELLDTAQREPVTITRRGRTVAFIVSPEDMRDVLNARDQRQKAVADFKKFFKTTDAQTKGGASRLTESDVRQMVNALR